MSLGEASNPLAKECHQNHAEKNEFGKTVQVALDMEEFQNIISINAAAAISSNYDDEDGIEDLMSHNAAIESPFTKYWDPAMTNKLNTLGQHDVFGYFLLLLDRRKGLQSH